MNKFVYKSLLLALTFCIITVKLFAQTGGTGKITAKILDAQTNETIPYASAVLTNKSTSATVRSAQTDVNGALNMTGLPNGVFSLRLVYVGYQTITIDSIVLSSSRQNINLNTVKMSSAKGTNLQEVTIVAPKSTMQLGIDKKVFSVEQSIVSEGGSATDVLQNVPSVQTDMDGNVSLRGSSGVRVLIDGKPSLIAGGNVAQILQSIPASSIESVEVITNPSAKYDAEGQSGIINIILKKNKKLGFNGNVALTAGNRDNYNANTSLSFQNKSVNIYGNYSYRYGTRFGDGYNNISYINTPFATAFANQNSDSESNDKGHNVKAGIDYYLAEKSVVSFSGGFNLRDNNRSELIAISEFDAARNPLSFSNRDNSSLGSGSSYDLNLDFTQKFAKPREELTFNLNYSEGDNNNYQTFNTQFDNVTAGNTSVLPQLQINDGNGVNRNYNVQADYTKPIGEFGKIEAGYRTQIRFGEEGMFSQLLNNVTNEYDINFALTNEFESKDQIHALYLNYQNQIKNFGYQLGLRGEDARLDTRFGSYNRANQIEYTNGKVDYTRLYPSVFLTQKFKGEQSLQLSYSRRVNRPRGWEVNPFRDVSEPFSQRQGNPNLRPEDVHAFELSYSKYWKGITFISSAYMRRTNDVIQWVRTEPDAQGVTLSTPQNLTRDVSTGLELIGRFDVIKKWNFTANANFYQNKIQGVPEFGVVENSGFSWNANVTNNITLPYNLSLQIRAEYRAPQVRAQGRRKEMFGIDAGAKYDFPDKKSSLSLNVRDVFSTRNFGMITEGINSITDFRRGMMGTMGNLTFSYRFGKTDFNFTKKKKADQEDSRQGEEF